MTYVINLAHINASNGMFWYASDRTRFIDPAVPATLLVQAHLAPIARRAFPTVQNIQVTTRLGCIAAILRQYRTFGKSTKIVHFTPHPLPFLRGQTIAFYDDYPFKGFSGALKRALFKIATWSSGCRIGIINRSLSLPFLQRCGVRRDRIFYESALPEVDVGTTLARSPTPHDIARIGLVGTDSSKKNYDQLFQAVASLEAHDAFCFRLYGADNDYTRLIKRQFQNLRIEIVNSDECDMPHFFESIDYLMSVSVAEGYGRPMGLAVQLGVPLFLLKSPVFLEFFGKDATFFESPEEMVRFIMRERPRSVKLPPPSHEASCPSGSLFFD